jgi:hypothetical protein
VAELISKSDFVRWKITNELNDIAFAKAQRLGNLRNSITKGEGNIAGYLGEEVVKRHLGGVIDEVNLYNHDILVGRSRIEVKTKRRTVYPKIDYEVSVAKTSRHQRPDYYVFTSVDAEYIWILGFIEYQEFLDLAREVKAGETDVRNGFVCHTDMLNLEHQFLYPIRTMLDVLPR